MIDTIRAIYDYITHRLSRFTFFNHFSILSIGIPNMITHEFTSPARAFRWDCYRHGFYSESYKLYSFDKNDLKEYVSDVSAYIKCQFINGKNRVYIANKLRFLATLARFGFRRFFPKTYGYIQAEKVHVFNSKLPKEPEKLFKTLLSSGKKLVFKPNVGGGGRGVFVVSMENGSYFVNQRPRKLGELTNYLLKHYHYLIQAFVDQTEYSSNLYPNTPNTIRIATMQDVETKEPFITAAVHRIGTKHSYPVDNFNKGGLCAYIDLSNGVLSSAVTFRGAGTLHWYDNHPDTGIPIKGATVSNWDEIKKNILLMAKKLSFLPFIGWDIIVTDNGMKIIEGNSYPNPDVFQIHKTLLNNPRIRAFYKKYKAI